MTFKKFILRGLFGIPIGVFIGTTIALIIWRIRGELVLTTPVSNEVNSLATYTFQYITSSVIGFVFAGASVIFDIDAWSIARQTIIHFIIISAIYLPGAVFAGWIKPNIINILVCFGVFAIIYIAIWISQYFTWRRRIEKLNHRLENK